MADQDLEAIDEIQKGDLIKVDGAARKVRHVSRYSAGSRRGGRHPEGSIRYVYFSINRKSWTGQPYTVLNRHALRSRFEGVIQRDVDLRSTDTEARVQDAVEASLRDDVSGKEVQEIADHEDATSVL